jgi:hypothetical protein
MDERWGGEIDIADPPLDACDVPRSMLRSEATEIATGLLLLAEKLRPRLIASELEVSATCERTTFRG